MKTEMRKLEDVKPYPGNPRINDKAVAAVAESIKQYGFRQPIVVDKKGVIVCGHTRWKAAVELGLKEVPVHVASDLTPKQVRAYRIADNKTGETAEWNLDLLPIELTALQGAVDWTMLGFDQKELMKLIDPEVEPGNTDPNEVPDPPDEATTKSGDIWLMPAVHKDVGVHRLMCGDSGYADDVKLLMGGESAQMVHTDPPYNVSNQSRSKNSMAAGTCNFPAQGGQQSSDDKLRAKDRAIENDALSDAEFEKLLYDWFNNIARVLVPGRAFYIWGGYANLDHYPGPLKAAGLKFAQAIIWVKQHPVMNRKDFMGNHEWVYYGWKEGAAHQFFGPDNVPDVWEVKKIHSSKTVHLTEKPVELAVKAMQYSSKPGENVVDLFGGSGSTLIAAEQAGRRSFLMEIDPLYCDVIVERWEKFTGRKADLLQAEPITASQNVNL